MRRTGRLCVVIAALCGTFCGPSFAAPLKDPTQKALETCLEDPGHGSTADQDDCETAALSAYDKRMNEAYSRLQKTLPPPAAQDLKAAQRAWIAYRDLEAGARNALFETRSGTMYAPMQAGAESDLTRDRALLLESYLRVLDIDGP